MSQSLELLEFKPICMALQVLKDLDVPFSYAIASFGS